MISAKRERAVKVCCRCGKEKPIVKDLNGDPNKPATGGGDSGAPRRHRTGVSRRGSPAQNFMVANSECESMILGT